MEKVWEGGNPLWRRAVIRSMRGSVDPQGDMLCLISPESRVPQAHPLRRVKLLVDQVLGDLSPLFDEMYAQDGRPSIPPERLLKAKLLQALYTIRSEKLLVEALEYNLLFRWFLDLSLLEPVWDNSTFTKNQARLLQHQTAELFFARIVELAREHGWVSEEHFTVDGTLVDAWASLKSFQPKNGPADPKDGDGSNPSVDFHGQKRSNATHQSTTDPAAQLARKGKGKEARLCFGLHALMENRHGLCVQAQVTTAHGVTEGAAATELLGRQLDTTERPPKTLGADKGYHSAKVVGFCRREGIRPHIAQVKGRRVAGLDGRTTRTLGYQTSQKLRKRIEEIFGWAKEIGGLRRTRKRGTARVGLSGLLILCAYNLVRMGKLLGNTS
jgi:transposase